MVRRRGLAALFGAVVAGLSAPPADAERLDALAAVVGTGAITCYEFEQAVDTMIRQLKMAGSPVPPRPQVERRVLRAKIDEQLQLQRARQLKLKVDDDEIEQAMAEVEQRNNIPAGSLPDVLRMQGVDFADYREQLRRQLLINKVVDVDLRSKIQVSEESMREYYRKYLANPEPMREVRLARILLALPSEPTPERVERARRRLERIRRRIIGGEKISALAPLLSDGPRASSGGDLGWHFPGAMPKPLRKFLEGPVGSVSAPIRLADGMNLIQITDERWHKPKVGKPYDEVHARHILLRIPEGADEATRARIRYRAEQIAQEMKKASDEEFATRAKEISQGPSSERGGDLGWFRRGEMAKPFEQAAFSLPVGGTSGVVETSFGLHIIRVVGRRHVDPNAFEVHKPKIEQQLRALELRDQMPRWLASLRQNTVVERRSCGVAPDHTPHHASGGRSAAPADG